MNSEPSATSTVASVDLHSLETIETELARRSLSDFVEQAWHIIEPGKVFLDNWHIHAICEHLEAVTRGDIHRLLINVPFRFMKSTLVSVMWPAWVWIDDPSNQWLCGSYAMKLAIRDSLKMRRLVESPWYRAQWGDRFQMTSDQNQKVRFENDHAGYRIAFGMDAGVMGEGGDDVIVDDPHDREGAHSEKERETTLTNYDEAVVTRLNDPQRSSITIIMQRLNEQDLSGHVLAKGGYEHLLIPMHYDPKRSRVTVIGWSDPRSVVGELAWPERFPEAIVKQIEADIGSYAAAGQLEQRPAPAEGGIFKRVWWQFYDVLPADLDEQIWSWDLSVKGNIDSDFVAGQAWARKGAKIYLEDDEVYARMDFPETIHAMGAFYFRHPHGAKLVEDKANGPAAIATLKDKIPGLIAVNPDGDKDARARAVAPYVEAGNVFLPNPYNLDGTPNPSHGWVLRLIENAANFPNGSLPVGSHGDDIDALTQGIHRLIHGIGQGHGQFEALRLLTKAKEAAAAEQR